MKHLEHQVSRSKWEIPFQIILNVVVFFLYSFDNEHPHLETHQFAFFLNYALAAFLINYVLMPRFFYRRKYGLFLLFTAIIIGATIVIEEFVLEKIYFPDTRGTYFPGILYSMLDVLPAITILCGFKLAWDLIHKQQEVEELRASVQESELSFLKSQIHPHFLFNNLNNLYSYALENSPKTPVIILELASVLRYMLYETKEEYVLLSKELQQLENFVKLNELQIEERGTVNFSAVQVEGQGYRIAPLILMVFVENAFKHSTASQGDKIEIEVEVKVGNDGVLHFRCENSYRETSNTESVTHGIGLENVKKRLEILYPDAYTLTIDDSDDYYRVNLSLDLN